VYQNSSAIAAGDAFPATVTVRWQIGYTSSFGSGSLEAFDATIDASIAVAEIQALLVD
jgi:hypothetical protein